jgi:TonB dependent receptor
MSWLRTLGLHLLLIVCPLGTSFAQTRVSIHIVDENGIAVSDAAVLLRQGQKTLSIRTDYLGRCWFQPASTEPYSIRVEKPGFYVLNSADVAIAVETQFVIVHQQQIQQEVDVVGAPPAIDPEQTSDASRMQTPEIVNIPYPTSRDIRNLLPYNPGVVPDPAGVQVHVAGSETWQTLDMLDGFNITSPVSGTLSMRFSPDAIRSTDIESTRYPVELGNTSGGIISFRSGMGDDRFRFNATNFIPSFQDKDGLAFNQFVPRFTFAGPIVKGRAWFYDGLELEYDNIVISQLPNEQNNNLLWRGSNLTRFQVNVTPANILTISGVVNLYHSPYDGISALNPQSSTAQRQTTSGFAYVRDQQTFHDGTVLEVGVAGITFDDSLTPHGNGPYIVYPEGTKGSFYLDSDSTSHRIQEKVDLYVSPQHLVGKHVMRMGADMNEIQYAQGGSVHPIDYLREDGTLLRQSLFPNAIDLSGNNLEFGAYFQDQYFPTNRWLIEPGARFDWDRVTGEEMVSPRMAVTYAFGDESMTKLSAGIGLYYDYAQLGLVESAQTGPRYDTTYAADGVTPVGPPVETTFTYAPGAMRAPRTLNWSLGFERKLPKDIFLRVNFLEKRGYDQFTFTNSSQPGLETYSLANTRQDHYGSFEITARHSFAKNYTLFGSYVRSSATTNAALYYSPIISILGPQGSGPLPWDAPNRFISWGWLPVPKTKRFDFVYAFDWRTGYPFSAVNANQELVGTPNSQRFPDYFSFDPGLEVRFHFRRTYFGLRGVIENATGHENPYAVINVVDSPRYLQSVQAQGRSFTARIRIIGSN